LDGGSNEKLIMFQVHLSDVLYARQLARKHIVLQTEH